jgi:hypothetical protein
MPHLTLFVLFVQIIIIVMDLLLIYAQHHAQLTVMRQVRAQAPVTEFVLHVQPIVFAMGSVPQPAQQLAQ